jgi:hypothetical protein
MLAWLSRTYAGRNAGVILGALLSSACSAPPASGIEPAADAGVAPDGAPGPDGAGRGTGARCAEDSPREWETFAKPFMDQYCVRCHSRNRSGEARRGAPVGHDFDTFESVLVEAAHIDRWAAAGPNGANEAMPPDGPLPSRYEREQLAEYLACAVRGPRPGGPTGAPCWGLTEPLADPQTPDEHACSTAIEHGLRRVQTLFAPYAAGAARIYRGTARAADNQDAIGLTPGFFDGPVVAELAEPVDGGGETLRISSPSSQSYVEIRQPDGSSTLFLSLVQNTEWRTTVEAEVPEPPFDLDSHPSVLRFDIRAASHYGTGEPLWVTVTADLTLVERSTVSARDVFDLARAETSGFTLSEGFWVRPVTRDVSLDAAAPVGFAFESCSRATTYRAEDYVSATSIADHGVRQVTLAATELCCSNCKGHCHGSDVGLVECFP